MAFANFDHTPMTEMSFADPDGIRARSLGIVESGLSGYVIRRAGDEPAIVRSRMHEILAPVLNLKLEQPFNWQSDVGPHNNDLDPHIDYVGGSTETTQLSLYWLKRGSCLVRNFVLEPEYAQGRRMHKRSGCEIDKVMYDQGKIDDAYVIPRAHETILRPTDLLVFSDAMNVHEFVTIEGPREAEVEIYKAAPATQQSGPER